jgi:predicted transcriptional regulator
MRNDGMTAKAIAAKHGVSTATVNLRLKKMGLTTPRKKGKK